MATAVITVASGGIAVVDVTATTPLRGAPVTEAIAVSGVKRGLAVTKVVAPVLGIPVTYIFEDGSLDTGGGVTISGSLATIEATDTALFNGIVVAPVTNFTAVRIHHLQW
jgi:hypothetical protein